jgi:hypothetical protein
MAPDPPTSPRPAKAKRVNVLEAYKLRTQHHLTYRQIAQIQGMAEPSVQGALQRFMHSLPSEDQLQGFTNARADLLNATSQRLLASLSDPEVLAKANLRDRAVTFGIIYDKHRLETKQSTSNISVLGKIIALADASLFHVEQTPQAEPCLETINTDETTSRPDIT